MKTYKIVIRLIAILAIFLVSNMMYVLEPNESALVKQFGRVVSEQSSPGVYFKVPFIQTVTYTNMAEHLYDLEASDVIT